MTATGPEADEKFIKFWESEQTAKEIAAQLEVRPKDVLNAWRRLRESGAIPRGDRPRSRQSNHRGEGNNADGRPRDTGSMLEALKREHPERD